MRHLRDWAETLALAGLALLLLIAQVSRDEEAVAGGRLLFPGLPGSLQVIWEEDQYALLLEAEGTLLADLTYRPTARVRERDAHLIRECLGSLRWLRAVAIDSDNAAQRRSYGLNEAVTLYSPEHGRLHCSTALDGSSFAWRDDPDRLLLLDRDPAAALRRHQLALRDPTLGLPERIERLDTGQGGLRRSDGRWWWREADGERWVDQQTVTTLLHDLRGQRAKAFPHNLPGEAQRRWRIAGSDTQGRPLTIELRDYGRLPTREERVLLRIDPERGLQEAMAMGIGLPALDASSLAPATLVPADPRQADAIRLGNMALARDGENWRLADHDDLDTQLLHALLDKLAALPGPAGPRRLRPASPASPLIVRWGEVQWSPQTIPRDLHPLLAVQAHELRDRRLLPDIALDDVQAVVVQPTAGAPRMHERDDDGRWTGTDHEGLERFLGALCTARVNRWTGEQDPGDGWRSTITLALADGEQRSLRLRRDGLVMQVERGLLGLLEADSRKRLMGE